MWSKFKKTVRLSAPLRVRDRMLAWSILASALLLISPPVSLLVFLGARILVTPDKSKKQAYMSWTLLWGGTLVLLLPSLIVHRNFSFVPQLLLGYAASSVLVARPQAVKFGFGLALIAALLFGVTQRYASSNLWLDLERSASFYELLSRTSVLNKGATQDLGQPWVAVKTWALPDQDELELSFDVRLLRGTVGSDWYSYNPSFALQKMSEGDEPFLRVYPPGPQQNNRFITREINTGAPLANRTFRTRVELRASESFIGRGCQGVRIQVVSGNGAGRCRDIRLDNVWKTYEFDWTVPPDVASPAIRLSLYNIDTASYDVRGGTLEELKDGRWQSLGPLEPEGLLIRLLPEHRALAPRIQVVPTAEWQRVRFRIFATQLNNDQVSLLAQVESDTELSLRNVQLESAGLLQPEPLPPPRQSLWFSHANLAGHSLLAAGLIAVSWAGLRRSLFYMGITFVAVFLTGSRAALLALVLGVALYTLVNARMWRSKVFWSLITIISVVFVGTLLLEGRVNIFSQNINRISRFAIWKLAWETFLSHPWIGIGSESSFPDLWRASGSAEPIAHAHNLWLQFAAAYGVPGLLAMVWFTIGIVYLAWCWGGLRGLVLALPILIMNLFDYTLFSATVLFPLLLGLNTLRFGKPLLKEASYSSLSEET